MMTLRKGNGSIVFIHGIEPAYFEVMRILLLRGRNLTAVAALRAE